MFGVSGFISDLWNRTIERQTKYFRDGFTMEEAKSCGFIPTPGLVHVRKELFSGEEKCSRVTSNKKLPYAYAYCKYSNLVYFNSHFPYNFYINCNRLCSLFFSFEQYREPGCWNHSYWVGEKGQACSVWQCIKHQKALHDVLKLHFFGCLVQKINSH